MVFPKDRRVRTARTELNCHDADGAGLDKLLPVLDAANSADEYGTASDQKQHYRSPHPFPTRPAHRGFVQTAAKELAGRRVKTMVFINLRASPPIVGVDQCSDDADVEDK